MGKKKQREPEEPFFPLRIFVSQEDDGTDLYYGAHTDLKGLDAGTNVAIYERVADRIGTVEVSTTLKERE
jgi:hypothetical protein